MYQFFIETFVGIALGYFIGKYLDLWIFKDKQILVYVFIVLGIFAGLTNLIKRVMRKVNGGNEGEDEKR